MSSKYSIGDKVCVKGMIVGRYSTVEPMTQYIGKICKIIKVQPGMDTPGYRLDVDGGSWWWDERLLAPFDPTYPRHFSPIAGYRM
jgi:hypothetical protein